MLNDKQKQINSTDFINDRKNAKIVSKYEKSKRNLFILSCILSLIIIGVLYILLDVSNISKIEVKGNIYLKSEDIVAISELKTSDKFLFTSSEKVVNKIKANNLIDTCVVEKNDDRSITISVSEKKIIGYSFEENSNVLVLNDDTRLSLNKDNLYLIGKVPLIEGFNKDQLILIEKNLADVDYKMINEISEIHFFPLLKFQDHEVIMRDGNYVFTSVYGLNLLNRYYDMNYSFDSAEHKCYYIEDISGNAYVSACPWEESPTEEKQNDDVNQEQTVDAEDDNEDE